METPCVHYEKIEDVTFRGTLFRLGTCQKCGQIKWYDNVNCMTPPVIIRPGRSEAERKEEEITMAKLKSKEKKELLKLGVDKFMEIHHYDPRAKSCLTQSYDKQVAKQLAKKKGKLALQLLDSIGVVHPLPPLMVNTIALLPNPPKELNDEHRKHIKDLFCITVDIIYGKQELTCHVQQSAPGK